ncbi:MAG: carboxypeptidase regulatory-like domain-containing protein, partial [Gemmatimonadales bacterium]
MSFIARWSRVLSTLGIVALAGASGAAAQGLTTAAVRGHVTDAQDQPVASASIVLTNGSTGQRFIGRSQSSGAYRIENVAVGGPYTLEARAIGFQPVTREGIMLSLGQALELDLQLSGAVMLAAIEVQAEELNPLTAVSRTGSSALVSDSAVSRLPTLNRNFTDFIITAPQVVTAGGASFGGGHRKQNNIQIDGVSENDLFGLGATGQPGGQANATAITLEAVKEFQILVAPFDIRQGGFAGGLLNAITKRGTNSFHGSAFFYFQDDALVRDSIATDVNSTVFSEFGEYSQNQFGFSFGGPIQRDRAHFFVAFEQRTHEVPISGATIGRESLADVGIDQAQAQRVVDTLQAMGVNAGDFGAVPDEGPNTSFFARLDLQLSDNHSLTLRHNFVDASDDNISHSTSRYRFTSNGYQFESQTNSSVLQLNSTLGGGSMFNELRVGVQVTNDSRTPNESFPMLRIDTQTDTDGDGAPDQFGEIRVGAEQFSQLNSLDQSVIEITDDLTIPMGEHTFTIGTHNEFIHFNNKFFHSSIGVWNFRSVADLEARNPRDLFRQLPFDPARGPPIADFTISQFGFYVQDQWQPASGLNVTLGARVDIPTFSESPVPNPDIAASTIRDPDGNAINTSVFPSGNLHFSGRLGLNFDVTGNRSTILRGGAGVFTGRPPYVWMSNAFTNTGREVVSIFCSGGNVPAFDPAAANQPETCADGSGGTAGSAQINIFDDGFKLPQNFKVSLGIDQRLPGGILGTVEFLYNRALNQVLQQELNIAPAGGYSNRTGLGPTTSEGRLMYGEGDSRGSDAERVDGNFTQVLWHGNQSRDRSFQLTISATKTFSDGFEFQAGYTYSDVKDLSSFTSSIATSNFGFTPISQGGDPNNKPLATSWFSVPHKVS